MRQQGRGRGIRQDTRAQVRPHRLDDTTALQMKAEKRQQVVHTVLHGALALAVIYGWMPVLGLLAGE